MQIRTRHVFLSTVFALLSTVLLLCQSCTEAGKNGTNKTVFRYNQPEALSSLDPAFARNQANIWATTQLYNGLVELDQELKIGPSIAKSWEVSEDGRTYSFVLRDDVYFHDHEVFKGGKGRKVTAQDVAYSFKRIIDPATASTGAWIFNDKVLTDKNGAISDTAFLAVNDSTFKIYLNEPFIAFLEILTMPYAFIVPQEAVAKYGKDFRANPVGTGPFVFKQWDEGNAIIMHKNPKYWKKDEIGVQLPYLDAVQISFITDRKSEFLTFMQGKLDFLSGVREGSRDLILNNDGTVQDDFKGKFTVRKEPYLNTEYIGFQLDPKNLKDPNPAVQDKRVRQALNYAINKKEMIAYFRNNIGIPGHSGIVPPSLPSFSQEKVPGYSYNPKKARELLTAAGYSYQKPLKMRLSTVAEHKELAEYMQKKWAEVGVQVEIDINQGPAHQETVDNGRAPFFMKSWLGDYPDAENYLALFYSKNFSPAGPNKTHFVNKEFDRLYEQAKLERDVKKRWELYQAMDRIVVEECPVIVLYYDEVLRLTQNNIQGLEPNPMNLLKLERVRKL
ncbi:ABC transporter substrate-binding protein [Pontibacter sp. BT310]|uniref:ABC transporter substrate-binding protein n=1 Tax=Pontibacter populi TaxID=890055 RepID=A0ABS6XB75_9BACT|nr:MULTISPECIES: ABC transporter substrate-binding protein [Pontibacter]MBJ6118391.1 ABC transporter substrate-binding protein [Pontibacter sp. BT310]MBR0570819.1 ABC transporter substrate-binding protein [Microvirga sp. STS03]MBW3365245.1 ABC transporter substrate-binding protein [Pontibacter populi]